MAWVWSGSIPDLRNLTRTSSPVRIPRDPETLEHIDRCGVPRRGGVLHSFSGDAEAVVWARRRGFMLGIGGPVTYKNSQLPDLVAAAGPDMILLETDAPDMTVAQHRGERNSPEYLPFCLDALADVRDTDPLEVARITTQNVRDRLGLDRWPPPRDAAGS